MPTLITRISNNLMSRFNMKFKSSFAGWLIFILVARKTNSPMLRLCIIFKSISGGYLIPIHIAILANTLKLRLNTFPTVRGVVKDWPQWGQEYLHLPAYVANGTLVYQVVLLYTHIGHIYFCIPSCLNFLCPTTKKLVLVLFKHWSQL